MSLSTAEPQAATDAADLHRFGFRNRRDRRRNYPEKEILVALRGTAIADYAQDGAGHKTELAARLKQLRAEHGLSLSQLARATGISSSFLSLIEQAQSDITIGRLVRLAEFYDVELADLLNGPPCAPADHVRILRTAPDHMLHR